MRTDRDFAAGCFAFIGFFCLGGLLFALASCTTTETTGGIQSAFDAIGLALTPAAPWAAPILHSLGTAVSSLWGTNGVLVAAGALTKHQLDFGVTPGRRRKLAAKRAAHKAAPKQA